MSDMLCRQSRLVSVDRTTVLSVHITHRRAAATATATASQSPLPVLLFIHGLGSNKVICTESTVVLSTDTSRL